MDRIVTWAERAWADLDQVAEYIAKDSPRYAAAFVYEVRSTARSLTLFAEVGRRVPEFGNPSIREIFVGKYRLIYQVQKRSVHILAFIHGARDLAALWKREGRDFENR